MSLRHPSRTTRRLLQLASLSLAGLLAGLLTGCNSTTASLLTSHSETGWQTSSTYASATASARPREAFRTSHAHPCVGAACQLHTVSSRTPTSHHRTM